MFQMYRLDVPLTKTSSVVWVPGDRENFYQAWEIKSLEFGLGPTFKASMHRGPRPASRDLSSGRTTCTNAIHVTVSKAVLQSAKNKKSCIFPSSGFHTITLRRHDTSIWIRQAILMTRATRCRYTAIVLCAIQFVTRFCQ